MSTLILNIRIHQPYMLTVDLMYHSISKTGAVLYDSLRWHNKMESELGFHWLKVTIADMLSSMVFIFFAWVLPLIPMTRQLQILLVCTKLVHSPGCWPVLAISSQPYGLQIGLSIFTQLQRLPPVRRWENGYCRYITAVIFGNCLLLETG